MDGSTEIAGPVHLRAGGVSVVVGTEHLNGPEVLYWGTDLGDQPQDALAVLRVLGRTPVEHGMADNFDGISLIPEPSEGWLGNPCLVAERSGRPLTPALNLQSATTVGNGVHTRHLDEPNGLGLDVDIVLHPSGLLDVRASLVNLGSEDLRVDRLAIVLPVPGDETVVLDQSSRHMREHVLQFHPLTVGEHSQTTRGLRALVSSTVLGTCTPGTRWEDGRVHYLHVAWSGNTHSWAQRTPHGLSVIGGEELLEPGEIVLGPGQSYATPPVLATWGQDGLARAAWRFHDYVRALPAHPSTPRPVTLNGWEAVYFDHSLPKLLELVRLAGEVVVERFVLDDGWFGSRRDSTSGLGDWYVSKDVWPDGLWPLVEAVRSAGMQFGLWFEPEMVNLDSDLAREHPDWIVGDPLRLPVPMRRQQAVNLTIPEAWEQIHDQVAGLVREYSIDYIKWDYNRDLPEPVGADGTPLAHAQVKAVYAMMDSLREEFPDLEIESCASGGGRADLGVMAHAQRMWGSDCIDPLERQAIEAGTKLLLPPEVIGSHVSTSPAHTTGRAHSLQFRAITALFDHMGVEWDLTVEPVEARQELARWIEVHKRHRHLLHTGRVLRTESPDSTFVLNGAVAVDASEALVSLCALGSSAQEPRGLVRIPGLDPERTYELSVEGPCEDVTWGSFARERAAWTTHTPLTVPGRVLMEGGLAVPALNPSQALLLHLRACD